MDKKRIIVGISSVLHRLALGDRRLGEILAAAEFLQDAPNDI